MTQDKLLTILSILDTDTSNGSKALEISKFIDDSIISEFMKLLSEYQSGCK